MHFQKTTVFFFFVFFNRDYTFYTKNLFIRPKNCVQIILYNERCKEFRKNQFSSNIFTFLIVTHQNFDVLQLFYHCTYKFTHLAKK